MGLYAASVDLDTKPIAKVCKALGDEQRLRILALLAHGELCVCHIVEALALPQPVASRHLAILRSAGIVETRRNGRWIYYRLSSDLDDVAEGMVKPLIKSFA